MEGTLIVEHVLLVVVLCYCNGKLCVAAKIDKDINGSRCGEALLQFINDDLMYCVLKAPSAKLVIVSNSLSGGNESSLCNDVSKTHYCNIVANQT